jgi:hypothetical protein
MNIMKQNKYSLDFSKKRESPQLRLSNLPTFAPNKVGAVMALINERQPQTIAN